MPEQVTIRDANRSVTLLNVSGFDIMRWNPGSPTLTRSTITSPLSDGDYLRRITRRNVVEEFECTLLGTSNDNLATQIQLLYDLLEQAQQYHTTDWQTTPVYLQVQMKNETNTRYSLLFWGEINVGEYLSLDAADRSIMRNVTIRCEREPWWRSNQPGVLPTPLNFGMLGATNDNNTGPENIGYLSDLYIQNCDDFDTVNNIT